MNKEQRQIHTGRETKREVQMENSFSDSFQEIINVEIEKCLSIVSALIYTHLQTNTHITLKQFHTRFEN